MRPRAFTALALCAAMAACSSPSLKYLGAEPFQAEVAGLTVDVYAVPGSKAETIDAQAVIVSGVFGIPEEDLREIAAVAISRAAEGTPCRMRSRSLKGSSTVWSARLGCKS